MSTHQLETEMLVDAGRLLLEYNESSAEIHRALESTARAMTGEDCRVSVAYRGISVSFGGGPPAFEPVAELRYNTALQSRVHAILEQVRRAEILPPAAHSLLQSVEGETPRHSRWLAVLLLGAAAVALAFILGADEGGAAAIGASTALGFAARQELGRRHASLLTLPFTAALIGALCGGLAFRLGWTRTPELAVMVPSLMLVPGPHFINGLLDLVDNHLPMSMARLALAVGILLAAALGIVLGVRLTLPDGIPDIPARADHLNLATDMLLAAVVTCGFAVFYNTPWRFVAMASAGGAAGHGLRFLALQWGCHAEIATFLGGLAVGMISSWLARSGRFPVAVIAFSGAVTMMPGLAMFRALGGCLQISRSMDGASPAEIALTIGHFLQASLVVGGLALGLVCGLRIVPVRRSAGAG